MRRKKIGVRILLIGSAMVLLLFLLVQPFLVYWYRENIPMLFPSGIIALKERNLLLILQLMMLLVIFPVYIFTFIFSWKFRASNPKGVYDPDLIDNKLLEVFWWGIPLIMTALAGWLTWVRTEQLDPYKPLVVAEKKALSIQVVALQWKWLFIYPEEQIASVNFLQFPTDRPLHFQITADAPMNSFWIPALGGQIYAMPGMRTQIHMIANEAGDFRGSSANLSGEGFADMVFTARASDEEGFQEWLKTAHEPLNYEELKKPGISPAGIFKLEDRNLFEHVWQTHP